ncbi:hypothetical protein [Sodalis sp.]|uniref:hypothetical protein n=1 Tax=Sodalis sp. (in: enterobacteria) TaxID=1898979 RepID=UPI003873350C
MSLIITEKGYCIEPDSSQLDRTHPRMIADLTAPHAPRAVSDILMEALNIRFAAAWCL